MKRICKQCGKEFELSQSEINFYKEKNLTLPKRCKECRNANKQKRGGTKELNQGNAKIQPKSGTSYSAESAHKRSGVGTGVCVLAIAVVLAFYAVGKVIPVWIGNTATADVPVHNQNETVWEIGTEYASDHAPSTDRDVKSQTESFADIRSGNDTVADIDVGNDTAEDIEVQSKANPEIDSGLDDAIAVAETVGSNSLTFRNVTMLEDHFQKHGIEMGFSSAEEYQAAAAAVVNNADSLHKLEAEDGDDVYYLESTNEFVIVSTDGYIRTYFNPEAGIEYYNRQ